MDKKRFRDLLTDLYQKYNPAHLPYVDELVERNHGSPYAAIETIFRKYNHKNLPHYDPVKATDQYRIDLLKAYEAGGRPFRDVDLEVDAASRVEVPPAPEVKGPSPEEREKEVERRVAAKVDEAIAALHKKADDGIDYTITMDNVGEEVLLPNKRHLASLGIGARLVLRSATGKPLGFVIKDITYDSFSLEDKVLVMVHLNRE